MFAYCSNNPINRIDASGTDSVDLNDVDGIDPELSERGGNAGSFSGGSFGGKGNIYYNSPNPIDLGHHYGVDLSQASNSSSFYGGIPTNGYAAYSYHTNPCSEGQSSQSSNPLTNIVCTEKVANQMQGDDFHGFPLIVDNYGALGKLTLERGNDGNLYNNLRIPGSYLGYDGVFHYIWNSSGICNHRQFVQD